MRDGTDIQDVFRRRFPVRHRLMLVVVATVALLLFSTSGNAQYVLTTAIATGPNGDAVRPNARPGETITVQVRVASYLEFGDTISVSDLSLIIHHRNGDVRVPNLVSEPVYLFHLGDSAEFSASFSAHCDEPEVLSISYTVQGMIHWGGPITGGPAGGFSVQFGTQITIAQDMPLTITRAGTNAVQVSWPASPCHRLEICDAMDGQWRAVPEIPALIEGSNRITFDTAGKTQQFYRLARP